MVAASAKSPAPPSPAGRQRNVQALLDSLELAASRAFSAPCSPASPHLASPTSTQSLGLERLQLCCSTEASAEAPSACASRPAPSRAATPASRQLLLGSPPAGQSQAPSSTGGIQCAQLSPGPRAEQQQQAGGWGRRPVFNSSQERRDEIQLCLELAAAAWSSQEDTVAAQGQQQQRAPGAGLFASSQERKDEIALLSEMAGLDVSSQEEGAAGAAGAQRTDGGVLCDSSRPNSQGTSAHEVVAGAAPCDLDRPLAGAAPSTAAVGVSALRASANQWAVVRASVQSATDAGGRDAQVASTCPPQVSAHARQACVP